MGINTKPKPNPAMPVIDFLPIFGQSESTGYASTATTTAQRFSNLMFSEGVCGLQMASASWQSPPYADAETRLAALVPLVEYTEETPSSGATEMVSEIDNSFTQLAIVPGIPGTKLLNLWMGDAVAGYPSGTGWLCKWPYKRMVDALARAVEIAIASNRYCISSAMTLLQGTADVQARTARATYLQMARLFRAAYRKHVVFITKQATPPIMIIGQTCSHLGTLTLTDDFQTVPLTALAQWDAFLEGTAEALVPQYQYLYLADTLHHSAADARRLGAALGLARYQSSLGQDCTLYPIHFTRSGNVATITFHVPVGSLTLDTTWVAANDSSTLAAGIAIADSGGTPQTISSYQIVGNTIEITMAAPVPAGAVAQGGWYVAGWNGSTKVNGRLTGPRINLRDQQGDSLVFNPAGTNFPMHNWCPLFDFTCED